ncbi:MAG: hypothetical protein ABSF69_14290 [Polyangiaceae bacterium]
MPSWWCVQILVVRERGAREPEPVPARVQPDLLEQPDLEQCDATSPWPALAAAVKELWGV